MENNSFKDLSRLKSVITEFRDEAGVHILGFFKKSFDNQGFTDRTLKKWEKRKPQILYYKKSIKERKKSKGLGARSTFTLNKKAVNDANRPILVGTERHVRLKNSLKKNVAGLNITISSDKPYAQIHNEGGYAGKNKKAKIPQREFMGESETLTQELTDMFHKKMMDAFNSLPNI